MEIMVKKILKVLMPRLVINLYKKVKSAGAFKFYKNIEKVKINCPLCGSVESEEVFVGDRYGMGIRTVICPKCKFIYTNPQPTSAEMIKFYSNDYRRYYFSAEDPYLEGFAKSKIALTANRRAEEIFKKVSEYCTNNPIVLDIGCGEGALLESFRRAYPEAQLYGCEPDIKYSQYAAERSKSIVINGGLDDFIKKEKGRKFDIVTISHVLEHMLDPIAALRAIKNILATDGILYIEVPNMISEKSHGISMFHIAHLVHFIPGSLLFALNISGLSPVKLYLDPHDVEDYAMSVICKRTNVKDVREFEVEGPTVSEIKGIIRKSLSI